MVGVARPVACEPVLLHTLAGFVMHRDRPARVRRHRRTQARRANARSESALVERLVRMRPWLPMDRQAPLDEAIRALRAHTLPAA